MSTARAVAFDSKFTRDRWSPVIPAAVGMGGVWRPVEFYVDSGAACTIITAAVAEHLGFDYQKGQKVFLQVGDGALIPVFSHDLPIYVAGQTLWAPVGFSAKLGVPFNLLDRRGVFEHFWICFHETRRLVVFQPLGFPGNRTGPLAG